MGIEKVGDEFGCKITFRSPCDIQKIWPSGDKALVEACIRMMCEKLLVNGGGFIAKSYGASLHTNVLKSMVVS